MKRTVQVNVTWEDIRRATPKSARACPVAHALMGVVSKQCEVGVSYERIVLFGPFQYNFVLLRKEYTEEIPRFAFNFDLGRPVHPFSFTLEIDEQFLKPQLLLPEFAHSLTEKVIAESAQVQVDEEEVLV